VSSVAAVIAVIVGVRAGICRMALPTPIVCVFAARKDRTLTASEPYASAAQTTAKLGFADEREVVGEGSAHTP